jgi:hypothetical protein
MKRLFVAISYSCDQNEPSKPAKQLLAIEDTRVEQELLAYAKAELTEPEEHDGDLTLNTTHWPEYADYVASYDQLSFILFTEVTL